MKLDLIGLTNALTDITFRVTEIELGKIGIKKGGSNSLKEINQKIFLEILKQKEIKYCVAGSPGNVILNSSRLGLKTALFGSVGCDSKGKNYIKTLNENRITPFINQSIGDSGFCYILITPDGERTNIANIGVSGNFYFDFEKLKDTKFFHTSGYELITNPEKVKEAIKYTKKYGVKLSFDLADKTMVKREKSSIENLLEKIDILFATEEEARELTGESPYKSLELLSEICPIVALKKGRKGSIVKSRDEEHKIEPYPVKVMNTCGAGDAYASGFLFAHLKGFSLENCGTMGSYIASRVCASNEAHL
jgi:sugar/nucleoside kinase (ribokinase family)